MNTMRVCGTKAHTPNGTLCLPFSAGTGVPKLTIQPSLFTRGEIPGRSRDGLVEWSENVTSSPSLKHGLQINGHLSCDPENSHHLPLQ